jgi:hypothetical protein
MELFTRAEPGKRSDTVGGILSNIFAHPTATFMATGFLPSGKHLLGLRRGRDEETHLQGGNRG